jgi:hypothetical protein
MTAPPAAPVTPDYTQFVNKKVILTVKNPDDAEGSKEREGTIVTATPVGIMFRDKGRATSDILLPAEILGVVLAPDNRKITPKYIKEVELGNVRTHLADRHGFLLEVVNDLNEEQAKIVHDKQHAEHGGDLGHIHGERPRTQREQAIADAEAKPDDGGALEDAAAQDEGEEDPF